MTSNIIKYMVLLYAYGLINPTIGQGIIKETFSAMLSSFFIYYSILFILGLITTVTEWQNIYSPIAKKICYIFTFPIFMFTYVPIALVALFKKVEWSPITHTCVKSIHDIREHFS